MEQGNETPDIMDDVKVVEIRRILSKNSVFTTDDQLSHLLRFVRLLREWNRKINLISRRDVENVWEAHILHSLGIMIEVEIPQGARLLDLGSGGGLPGIPIKILRPDLDVSLIDATRKKTDAVSSILNELGIEDVAVVWGRAEDKAKDKSLARSFDIVVARAVAPLGELITWSHPFLSEDVLRRPPHPHLVALKGGDLSEEIGKAMRSGRTRDVRSKDLTFHGAELIPGVRKQIVSVYYSS